LKNNMADQNIFQTKKPAPANPPMISVGSGGAERAGGSMRAPEASPMGSAEVELPKEVKEAGVEQIADHATVIELPPDLKKIGMTNTGPSTPVSPPSNLPQVTLPITDDQVAAGLNASVTSALAWLATWCVRNLKKMNIVFKTVNGKPVRVKKK
jgi:hypothetical protein